MPSGQAQSRVGAACKASGRRRQRLPAFRAACSATPTNPPQLPKTRPPLAMCGSWPSCGPPYGTAVPWTKSPAQGQ